MGKVSSLAALREMTTQGGKGDMKTGGSEREMGLGRKLKKR
jgi:hypothetical protein